MDGDATSKHQPAIRSWVRMEDVAKLAGVTKMTVSRAMNDPGRVSAETRERIERAVRDTGFVPNRNAGSLTSRSTRIVAACIPTIDHAVFAATVQGMADVFRTHGYHLLLGDTRHSPQEEEALVEAFLSRRPDGIVLTGVRHSPGLRAQLQRSGVPIVEVWERCRTPIDMLVSFSNYDASHAMTRYLIGCGYRRIAFINGQRAGNERVQRREQGYRRAMTEAGLPCHVEVVRGDTVRLQDGSAALARILDANPGVDAAFAANDIFAAGALHEAVARGLEVPGRFGVAGFHDLEIASAVTPALTTVRAPAYGIGHHAAKLLLDRIGGSAVPRAIHLPYELVPRGTTRLP